MKLEILENSNGKIGKCNQKHWKIHLEIGIRNWIVRWSWKHWKIELKILENGIRIIGKWNWEHWKMKFETNEIELDLFKNRI